MATVYDIDGARRVVAPLAEMPIILVPDRREVKITELEARVRELEERPDLRERLTGARRATPRSGRCWPTTRSRVRRWSWCASWPR